MRARPVRGWLMIPSPLLSIFPGVGIARVYGPSVVAVTLRYRVWRGAVQRGAKSRISTCDPGHAALPNATYRLMPRTRLIGRHLQWPAQIRAIKPDAFFGAAGALPLSGVGCPSVITIHDLAIYRNARWFPARQPLSTRLVVPRSVLRADVVIAVSENTANDIVDIFGIDRGRIAVVPHGVSPKFRPMSAEERREARARLKLPDSTTATRARSWASVI